MANVINLNDHLKDKYDEQLITKIKLCRIRDEIEEKLNNYSIFENNDRRLAASALEVSILKRRWRTPLAHD